VERLRRDRRFQFEQSQAIYEPWTLRPLEVTALKNVPMNHPLRSALRGGAVALVALALGASAAVPSIAQSNGPYVIGAVLSLSGSGASLGQPSAEALDLLQKSVNAAGGIKGRHVEVRILDDGGDSTRAVSAMRQLASDPQVVAIIGSSQSPTSLAIKPIANDAKVVDLSLGSSPQISHPVTPYVFQMPVPSGLRAGALFNDAKKHGLTKIALFVSNNDYGQVSTTVADDLAKANGFTIVDVESFDPLAPNVDSEVVRAKEKAAQAFFVFADDPGPALVAKSMVNQALTIPAYADSTAATANFLRVAGSEANNWRVASTKLDVLNLLKPNDPMYGPIEEFAKIYPAGKSPNHVSGTARDAFVLVIDAIKSAGSDRDKLRAAIENQKHFVGVTSVYTFSVTDHSGADGSGLVLVQGDNGKWKLAS
jgi:branched-chain amino acid transport system substrate-binding protein